MNDTMQESTRKYDVGMIHDFLDHLLLDVRTSHFGNVNEGGNTSNLSGELSQVKRYSKMYQTVLLPITRVDRGGCSDEEFARAIAVYQASQAQELREWLEHLEALDVLFKQALLVVSMGGQEAKALQPYLTWTASEILQRAHE